MRNVLPIYKQVIYFLIFYYKHNLVVSFFYVGGAV